MSHHHQLPSTYNEDLETQELMLAYYNSLQQDQPGQGSSTDDSDQMIPSAHSWEASWDSGRATIGDDSTQPLGGDDDDQSEYFDVDTPPAPKFVVALPDSIVFPLQSNSVSATSAPKWATAADLPTEILCEIFQQALATARDPKSARIGGGGGSQDYNYNYASRFNHYTSFMLPLLLSSVCRVWRTTALGYRRLWSSIYLDLAQPASVTDAASPVMAFYSFEELAHASVMLESQFYLVSTWLARARGAPLRCRVNWVHPINSFTNGPYSADAAAYYHPVLSLLADHAEQWEDMAFDLPLAAFEANFPAAKFTTRKDITALRALSLTTSDHRVYNTVGELGMFAGAHGLRSLSITNLSPRIFVLPLAHLEDIPIMSGSFPELTWVLWEAKNLREAQFAVYHVSFPPDLPLPYWTGGANPRLVGAPATAASQAALGPGAGPVPIPNAGTAPVQAAPPALAFPITATAAAAAAATASATAPRFIHTTLKHLYLTSQDSPSLPTAAFFAAFLAPNLQTLHISRMDYAQGPAPDALAHQLLAFLAEPVPAKYRRFVVEEQQQQVGGPSRSRDSPAPAPAPTSAPTAPTAPTVIPFTHPPAAIGGTTTNMHRLAPNPALTSLKLGRISALTPARTLELLRYLPNLVHLELAPAEEGALDGPFFVGMTMPDLGMRGLSVEGEGEGEEREGGGGGGSGGGSGNVASSSQQQQQQRQKRQRQHQNQNQNQNQQPQNAGQAVVAAARRNRNGNGNVNVNGSGSGSGNRGYCPRLKTFIAHIHNGDLVEDLATMLQSRWQPSDGDSDTQDGGGGGGGEEEFDWTSNRQLRSIVLKAVSGSGGDVAALEGKVIEMVGMGMQINYCVG